MLSLSFIEGRILSPGTEEALRVHPNTPLQRRGAAASAGSGGWATDCPIWNS